MQVETTRPVTSRSSPAAWTVVVPVQHGAAAVLGGGGVTVGPLVGLGAHWVRSRRDLWAGLGFGGLAGVLVGEGVYGLTVVSETTPAAYWWGSVLLGVLVATVASTVWLHGLAARVVAPVLAAAVAGAFVVVYVWGGSVFGLL